MNIRATFLAAMIMFTTHETVKGTDDEDDTIEWGGTSNDECESSQQCNSQDTKCCVRNGEHNTCEPLNEIGKPCSNAKAPDYADVYLGHCPCKLPFLCKDMGENISICVAPPGKRK
ncbi:uncharacterized protein LOC119377709 [Rhipicephalus sanguineus]|uniref:uncharacterized protein LOC119377709 n=1 Tax=Rhipicephalus sanguineus TaxID=34632 RepID=UPI0018959BB0|nr:uncharacterized protein LOC119377709 [Rhipicephalus sanguineus]